MGRVLKVLAILVLLATIAGAGLVLYGINTLSPVVTQTAIAVTPASQAQDVFDGLVAQLREETFTGYRFADTTALTAENCSFVTYSVRLENRGFFPAEWISLQMYPQQSEDGASYDVLQMDNGGAYVLNARSQGDIAATILHVGDVNPTQRTFEITCYVFGRQITVQGAAQ